MTSNQLQTVGKVTTVALLCLLMLGYLAFNLWDWPALAIALIRTAASIFIVAMLAVSLTHKVALPVLVIGIIALIGIPTSGISLGIFFICLSVLALRRIPVEFISNASACILGIALTTSVLLVYSGILENGEDVTGSALELGGEIRSRMTFGYKNVNSFAAIATGFCLLVMIAGNRIIARYLIALFVSYVLYIYTDSRAMLAAVFGFIAFTCIFISARNQKWFLKTFSGFMLIMPLLLSVLASQVVSEAPLLDLALSGRMTFVSMFFSEVSNYRLLIGGAEPSAGVTVDNSFALLAGAIGVPLLSYFTHITYKRVCRSINEGDFRTYSFILAFWIYSFAESSMLRPESIVCIVFWVLVLHPKQVLSQGKFRL